MSIAKTASPRDGSFALWWGRRRRQCRSRSPGSGAEPSPTWLPIWVLLLSLALWVLIWGAVSLGTDGLR